MMDFINNTIGNSNLPALSAFLIGILVSISPCAMTTNIAAVAYLSRNLKTAKNILLNGTCYALGRAISYTILATVIYFGFSAFKISGFLQGWSQKLLGPLFIFMGLVMLGVVGIKLPFRGDRFEKASVWLARKGSFGSLMLGALFALAFCPYAAVLFFGALIPLVLKSPGGLLLPFLFAFGTGLPVVVFSLFIAFGADKIGKAFGAIRMVEKAMRYFTAFIFLALGVYYLRFLAVF